MSWKRFLALAAAAPLFAFVAASQAAGPSVAERLDRAERFQDWAGIEALAPRFALARREELYALTSILNACVARGCDEDDLIRRLRGPLVSDGVREFARAWLEYESRDPAAARPRFEALWRGPQTAWLGAYGRLAYAADARNAALLREAIRDVRANADAAAVVGEDLRNADLTLAMLEADDARLAKIASEGGDEAGALLARFTQELGADDFAAAEKTLERYARRWGEDHDLTLSRVELARAQRPPEEVITQAERALHAHPAYWRLRFSLAESLIDNDDEKAAREVFAARFPIAFANVRLELAMLPTEFGGVAHDDVEVFARWLEPYRDNPAALATLASAMLDAGRTQDAAELLDRADTMTDSLPATLNVRARMAKEAGRKDEYVRLMERLAARSPKEVTPQLTLALAYIQAGETVKAARVAAALKHSRRYVPPHSLRLLDKLLRDAEPSFRTASLNS